MKNEKKSFSSFQLENETTLQSNLKFKQNQIKSKSLNIKNESEHSKFDFPQSILEMKNPNETYSNLLKKFYLIHKENLNMKEDILEKNKKTFILFFVKWIIVS